MERKSQDILKRIRVFKRLAALVLLMTFFVTPLTAEAFVVKHRDHAHDYRGFGGSCAECAQVKYAESLLRQFGSSLISTLFVLIQLLSAAAVISAVYCRMAGQTLVKLKTRMDC